MIDLIKYKLTNPDVVPPLPKPLHVVLGNQNQKSIVIDRPALVQKQIGLESIAVGILFEYESNNKN